MKNKTIYFPGLNGLRAIAAIGVVLFHITLELGEFNLNSKIFGPRILIIGPYGVSIFFVLSGFLITYLLLVEKEIQTIDIKKFYFRRILRIWPLYYLYLAISLFTIIVFGLNLNTGSLLLYVFYAANIPYILRTGLPFLSHYWSLGVEEQFYLFWPWVIKKVNKYLLPTIFFSIIALVGTKICLHYLSPDSLLEKAITTTRFHCMMIGGIGAILYKNKNKIFLKIADNKLAQSFCWFIIFLVVINKYHIASIVDTEIISIVALFLIIGQIKIKNRIINLEIKIFDFLGKISYGIYVIHPLLIFLFSKVLKELNVQPLLKYLIVYCSITGATVIISYISYEYFEKYFLKLKQKFVVVKSSAKKKLEMIEINSAHKQPFTRKIFTE